MIIQENITLAPYTVFKIGGPARYFCEVQNLDEVREAVLFAHSHNVPLFILGAGSNILVSDEGFPGIVIKMNLRGLKVEANMLYADAGVSMAQAVNLSVKNGLGGFEWGVGVPGTVGGSVFGNAGCYGGEMSQLIERVWVLKITGSQCETFELLNKDCQFAYRDSIFKKNSDWVILGATMKLQRGDSDASRAKVLELSKKRIVETTQTSGRMGAQEIGAQCAGCIFKNPKQDLAAGFLIDTAGLKGLTVGGAMVSKKHANFIINTGSATAHDIKELISIIKSKVKSFHGVELEEEVRYL